MMQTASFDVAIHGAGLVGQSLALHLAKTGFSVALIGRESNGAQQTVSEDVRAFALGHPAKAWLESVGAWSNQADTTPVTAMHITGDDGGKLDFKASTGQEALNWIAEVPALAARLEALSNAQNGITHLKSAQIQAALHIICDRRCDFWQRHIEPNSLQALTTTPYGQHAIAAKLISVVPHGQTARQWFNDSGEVLALLPTGGAGGNTYALVWSLTSSRAKKLAQAEPADFLKALEDSQNVIALELSSARALWPLNLSQTNLWTGVAQDGSISQHWVLAGDAAHTIHPLAGQGLNLGLADAALLAQKLLSLRALRGASLDFKPTDTQLGRLLRSYVRERKAATAQIAGVTDGLHVLYAHQNPLIQGLRHAGLRAVNNLSFVKQWLTQQV